MKNPHTTFTVPSSARSMHNFQLCTFWEVVLRPKNRSSNDASTQMRSPPLFYNAFRGARTKAIDDDDDAFLVTLWLRCVVAGCPREATTRSDELVR
jgi:hypothetical protein